MELLPKPTLKNISLALLRVVLLVYFGLALVLYFRQDNMLFFPDQTPFADCPEFAGAKQVDMEGTSGYFFQNGTSTNIMVFYHGNGGRACDRVEYRAVAQAAGYSLLVVEYSGYAGDGNSPSTRALLHDVEHAAHWVDAQNPGHLAVIGESIGTGAASYHSSLAHPEKLALIAPFDRLSNAAFDVYPVYPIRLLLHIDLDNMAWAKTAGSVLIIHGTKDPVIHFARGKALYDSLPQTNKEFIEVPGGTHEDVLVSYKTFLAVIHFLTGKKQE